MKFLTLYQFHEKIQMIFGNLSTKFQFGGACIFIGEFCLFCLIQFLYFYIQNELFKKIHVIIKYFEIYLGEVERTKTPSPAFVMPPRPKEEPETIRLWREQQSKLLEEKDAKEAEMMTKMKNEAEQELKDW